MVIVQYTVNRHKSSAITVFIIKSRLLGDKISIGIQWMGEEMLSFKTKGAQQK